MRKLLILVFLFPILSSCDLIPKNFQPIYDKADDRRAKVLAGKMKQSDAILAAWNDVYDAGNIGPSKAEGLRTMLVGYKAEKALEEGLITQEKRDEIIRKVKI